MKVYFSPYELRSTTVSRRGALLKVIEDGEREGYADCHPWPELGDHSLEEQLCRLSHRETTPLTAQSLMFARMDASLRKQNKSIFEGLKFPKNHYLVMQLTSETFTEVQEAVKQGFNLFKVKLGKALKQEVPLLLELMTIIPKVRLDFNSACTEQQIYDFLTQVKPFLMKIDFIEDPFPFEEHSWAYIQANYGVVLACDREARQACGKMSSAKVLVHKPAAEETFKSKDQKIIVTSYLDHPLGQACAAFIAAKYYPDYICGLNSHRAYAPNAYSVRMEWNSPEFKVPLGKGFGFDDLLQEEQWEKLI